MCLWMWMWMWMCLFVVWCGVHVVSRACERCVCVPDSKLLGSSLWGTVPPMFMDAAAPLVGGEDADSSSLSGIVVAVRSRTAQPCTVVTLRAPRHEPLAVRQWVPFFDSRETCGAFVCLLPAIARPPRPCV